MSGQGPDSGIRIVEVRVRNFRSLEMVDVSLDGLILLVGENNSGKTSFLEALFVAIGDGRRTISPDDIYLAPSEIKAPKDRAITIDLLIRPTDECGNVIDTFPAGSSWLSLWGLAISQDELDNDFVAIRTQYKWNATAGEYTIERRFLADWPTDSAKWDDARVKEKAGFVSAAYIEPLSLHFLDAKRDIQDDIRSRGSFWYRLVSDPGLTDSEVSRMEQILTELNNDIITSSEVLSHTQYHLNDLYQAVGSDKGSVSITPLTRHLRDLSKGMDVTFATRGAQAFPLSRHGMGTRSLASVLTFRAYTTWKQKCANGEAHHPLLALEEPESHLHPQAQRALYRQIEAIPGQRLLSTHSPYIAAQARIDQFRVFRKTGARTTVARMDTTSLSADDLRKIDRMVLNTRGEILYARAIVLCSGETEEQALPVFAEHHWGFPTDALGISFVGVGGDGNYLPFLRLASSFGIPWYIFSDGEPKARVDLAKSLAQIQITDFSRHPNVFVLPNEQCFETYLTSERYGDAIEEMLRQLYNNVSFVDEYIARMHGRPKKGGGPRDYRSEWGRQQAMTDILLEGKTTYAGPLASMITLLPTSERRLPKMVRYLFERISIDLALPAQGASASDN